MDEVGVAGRCSNGTAGAPSESPARRDRPMEPAILGEAFESHRGLLWSLCYRMTGCPADAEDVVQETFIRALQQPPKDTEAPLRPWLVTVALNLARDLLRRRRSHAYPGIWFPGPAELESEAMAMAMAIDPPQEGFDLLETGSYAFLVALEKLTPQPRAVSRSLEAPPSRDSSFVWPSKGPARARLCAI